MPLWSISIPDGAVPLLTKEAHRYNGETGEDLTVQQWVELHLREIAVAADIAAAVPAIQGKAEADTRAAAEKAQEDANAALKAERARLIAALDAPQPLVAATTAGATPEPPL